jgi:hypothetical protein
MAQTKGISFSYVRLPGGFVPNNSNRSRMKTYVSKQVDLTIKGRELGFGWYSRTGRKEITAEEYEELIKNCKTNAPEDCIISRSLLYLVSQTGQATLHNLTRDNLNRCLRPGAIRYAPAVYIVVKPKRAIKTAEQPSSPKRQKLRALFRMDALLDRLLTTVDCIR